MALVCVIMAGRIIWRCLTLLIIADAAVVLMKVRVAGALKDLAFGWGVLDGLRNGD